MRSQRIPRFSFHISLREAKALVCERQRPNAFDDRNFDASDWAESESRRQILQPKRSDGEVYMRKSLLIL